MFGMGLGYTNQHSWTRNIIRPFVFARLLRNSSRVFVGFLDSAIDLRGGDNYAYCIQGVSLDGVPCQPPANVLSSCHPRVISYRLRSCRLMLFVRHSMMYFLFMFGTLLANAVFFKIGSATRRY